MPAMDAEQDMTDEYAILAVYRKTGCNFITRPVDQDPIQFVGTGYEDGGLFFWCIIPDQDMGQEAFQEDHDTIIQVVAVVIRWSTDQVDDLFLIRFTGMLDHRVMEEIERIGPDIGTDGIQPVLKDPVAQGGPDHLEADGVNGAIAEDGIVEISKYIC